MRLWTLHPRYLDARGLVAVWRETLLAQKVLRGETQGYRNHPQLIRFKKEPDTGGVIAAYLMGLFQEATSRGYSFQRDKIREAPCGRRMKATRGQMEFEWRHLQKKLQTRDVPRFEALLKVNTPEPHPLFQIVPGAVEAWEVVAIPPSTKRRKHNEP